MWSHAPFRARVTRIIVDEFHVLEAWGTSFRPAYLQLSRLYHFLRTMLAEIFVQWCIKEITHFRDLY